MLGTELKKLSRRELVDVIYQMKKQEQTMQEEINALQAALQDKRLRLSAAGSVADAAASVSDLLSAAQSTADLYLNEIACMKEEARQECDKLIAEAQRKAEALLTDAETRYAALNTRYRNTQAQLQQLEDEIALLEEQKRSED